MQFSDLGLAPDLVRAVTSDGYTIPTPIQLQAIPHVLKGVDVLGIAQTGTGKTAAFALPVLHRLNAHPRAVPSPRSRVLVLCPTRELATQIGDSFKAYGRHMHQRVVVIFGGVGQNPQAETLRRGVEIIVATPGRLLDLVNQRLADLRGIEVLILDEADRMLDMGFIHDIRRLMQVIPTKRQTLMFSATMPQEIRALSQSLLHHPVSVQVAPVAATADRIDQSVYFVEKREKPAMLAHLVHRLSMSRAIVFTRTKHGADRVVRQLRDFGIRSEAVHGNKSQNARERALKSFRSGTIPLLIATDIASRGIDVDGITHVVNFDITHEPETYIHRIGRTARAGAEGCAVSLCDKEERSNLRAIERLIRREIPVKSETLDPAHLKSSAAPEYDNDRDERRSGRQSHRESDRGSRRSDTPTRSHPRTSDESRSGHPRREQNRVPQKLAAKHAVGAGVGARHPHSAPADTEQTSSHTRSQPASRSHDTHRSSGTSHGTSHAPRSDAPRSHAASSSHTRPQAKQSAHGSAPAHAAARHASPRAVVLSPNDRQARPNTAPRPAGPRPHHPVKAGHQMAGGHSGAKRR